MKITLRALNRAFLARQMLLRREPAGPWEALERLIPLQAQQLRPPFLALWTRLESFQPAALEGLLRERRAVRATMMRATLHIARSCDYAAFRQSLQPGLAAATLSILKARRARIDPDAVTEAAGECFRQTPQTFARLRELLIQRFPGLDERAMGYIARTRIPLVMVPEESESTFALASEWLGQPIPSEDRLEELILRYLGAFGPATPADAQTWLGLARLKPAFEALRPRLECFRDEKNRELFDLPEAPRPNEGTLAPVRFLPGFDNAILGHADRTRILAGEHRPRVTTKNLQVLPVFLVDGFVRGTWALSQAKNKAVLDISAFAPLDRRTKTELEAEGRNLLAFANPGATTEVAFR